MEVSVKFDHTQSSIDKALGLTEYHETFLKAAIFFECLATNMKRDEFYGNSDDVPRELSTVTSVLERVLVHCPTNNLKVYAMLMFHHSYRLTKETIEETLEKKLKKDKKAPESVQELVKSLVETLKYDSLVHVMAKIKKYNYDFDKFIADVLPSEEYFNSKKDQHGDIDDLLNNILNAGGDE